MGNRYCALLAIALAACGQADDQAVLTNADATVNALGADQPATAPVLPVSNAAAAPAPEEKAKTFPAAIHGRWGLVPSDCTSTLGDAKGLVTITADEVRFYESVARPVKIVERTDRVIRGEFDFTGEGMSWTNYMTWSVTGDRLTRVDSEEDSRLVYTRC